MQIQLWALGAALALGCALSPCATAQEADSLTVAPADSAAVDPTRPSGALEAALEDSGALGPRNNGASQPQRKPEVQRLPKLMLKARVFAPGREPAALLESEGQYYLVREGMEVNLLESARSVTVRTDNHDVTFGEESVARVTESKPEVRVDVPWRLKVLRVGETGVEVVIEPLGLKVVLQ